MNAPLHDEIKTSPNADAEKAAGPPGDQPNYASYPMRGLPPSWLGEALAFLGRLTLARMMAVMALVGIVVISVAQARAGPDLTTLGLIGASTGNLILFAIALVALAFERKRANGPNRQEHPDQPADA